MSGLNIFFYSHHFDLLLTLTCEFISNFSILTAEGGVNFKNFYEKSPSSEYAISRIIFDV